MGRRLKGWAVALLAGPRFALRSGHFRSALTGRPTDRRGQPLPWYSYPAIDYLSSCDFSSARVLEFGGGFSTAWWAARARWVTTIESDRGWFLRTQKLVEGFANVTLELRENSISFHELHDTASFDVIIVDGGDRLKCMQNALRRIRNSGMVILDDSQGYWGDEGTYPILDLMRDAGYMRVDLRGMSPGCYHLQSTSIFFTGECEFIKDPRPPKGDGDHS